MVETETINLYRYRTMNKLKKMKKEIIIKIVWEDNDNVKGEVLQKVGIPDNISGKYEIIGAIQKLSWDACNNFEKALTTTSNYTIKEPVTKKDGDEVFLV
jgi:hypothetical protein